MGLIPSPVRMMLPLAVVYSIRGYTFDEETLLLVRVASSVVQLISIAMVLYLLHLVKSRDDQTGVQLRESEINPPNPFVGAPENDPIQRWTAAKYDTKQTMQLVQQTVMSLLIGFFLHIQWGYIPPIVLTPIMGVLNFVDSPLFSLYFLNRTDRDDPDLKRPFKKTGPMAQLQESMGEMQRQAQSDGERGAIAEPRRATAPPQGHEGEEAAVDEAAPYSPCQRTAGMGANRSGDGAAAGPRRRGGRGGRGRSIQSLPVNRGRGR